MATSHINRRINLRRKLHWLSHTPLHPQWLMPAREVEKALRDCEGTILDIGSADRWLKGYISPRSNYIAIDYPNTAIHMYRTRPDVFADAHELPIAENSIDVVACFEVLEHVIQPEKVLRQIPLALKPVGSAYFSMPFLYPIHDAPHDFQRWTVRRWERSLCEADLCVKLVKSTNSPLHAVAVLSCLALAGPLHNKGSRPWDLIWRAPALSVLIPLINLSAWTLAMMWPSWSAPTTSYQVVAQKPS